MIPQELMIQKVRDVCEQDDTLLAAMMYGSFAKQSGDRYSDIEFVLFFEDDAVDSLDQRAWLSRIAPAAIGKTLWKFVPGRIYGKADILCLRHRQYSKKQSLDRITGISRIRPPRHL